MRLLPPVLPHLYRCLRGYVALVCLWLGTPAQGVAQVVHWATRVVAVSSEGRGEGGGQQFKATQVLGAPSVLPQVKSSPCAWSPGSVEGAGEESITVAFDSVRRANQVLVAESANAGAVVRVILYTADGLEQVIFSEKQAAKRATDSPIDPLLRIMLPDSLGGIKQVKVVLNPGRTKGINQLDAIGLTMATKPVVWAVPVAPKMPQNLEKENLGTAINTPGQEVAPVISPDGKTLYLTRNFNKNNIGQANTQDVWFSTLTTERTWEVAKNMGIPINNAGNNAISGISPDGKTVYLINTYKTDGSMAFGVSKSTYTKVGWGFPVECKIVNNYTKQVANSVKLEFTVSPDGATMILAVQRNQTVGDRDLYAAFRQADQTWSEPVSLGEVVNSAAEESSPFLAVDNRTLYFTSEGHSGFGNGDIFVTRRLDDSWTNWTTPENLGPAVNTPEWDGYFTIPAAGDFAYLSSRANSLGEDDIFRLKLHPAIRPEPVALVSGKVLDAISRKPVATEIVSGLLQEGKAISKVEYDPETGEYKLILPTQKVYTLSAKKDGYFPIVETVDLSHDKRFRDIRRNLYVMPVQPGAKLVLRGVLFKQSEADLLPGSEAELDQLLHLLADYPTMTILVEGHTDNQGDWGLNMKLAEERVQRVKQYLIGHGVAEARVQTKAWGPSKPIASNETDEKRRLNRRVEFTIVAL